MIRARIESPTYVVALESNEIEHHWQRFASARSISALDLLGQVRKESVAAFENAQANERLVAKVIEYLRGQGFGSGMTNCPPESIAQ